MSKIVFIKSDCPTIEFKFENYTAISNYSVDVQESAQLGEPFVAVTNGKSKLYFRKGQQLKEGTELIPLSKEELKSVGIEETANAEIEKLIGVEIEE